MEMRFNSEEIDF